MKITFLGTGHGIGTEERACSSALLETRGTLYLIDAGVDLGVRIRKAGYLPENVRAVFISLLIFSTGREPSRKRRSTYSLPR